MPGRIEHIAIVGGGVSGVFQTLSLLRRPNVRVTLIERYDQLSRGIAYSACHPCHLLNVRAANMSAHADATGHFIAWLEARGLGSAHDFVQRKIYGDYLAEQLAEAAAAAGDRFQVVRGAAVDLDRDGSGIRITLEDGTSLAADAAVLALGHFRPGVLPGIDPDSLGEAYINDPWSPDVARVHGKSGTVLIAGTGMTMVDIAFQLVDNGFDGRIIAVSRRGLLPLSHPLQPIAAPPLDTPIETTQVSALLAEVRKAASTIGWHAVIDQLRPHLQTLWQNASDDERNRFLRHLRPWWDIHRHRLSPVAHARIARLLSEGRLELAAGKFVAFERTGTGISARWRPRGSQDVRHETVGWIINCTGPGNDIGKSPNPLVRALLARGAIRPGFARMGLDVNSRSQVITRDGTPFPNLYALGPLTRGAFWEITAVPEIRAQTEQLAERLTRADI